MTTEQQIAPVITVDGPSGSGKGTLSQQIAKKMGWHLLDSGAMYRILAYGAKQHNLELDDVSNLCSLAKNLDVEFKENEGNPPLVIFEGKDVTHEVRTEECGNRASKIAQIPEVREALLVRQRSFRKIPGLVADGRDMGTVVFPEAALKIYLEASPAVRAKRRWAELQQRGIDVSLDNLFSEIEDRDIRDKQRKASPLVPASDAVILDTTNLSITEVFEVAAKLIKKINFS